VDLANTVYAFDATMIDLCLSVFPWAHYRRRDAAIKLHTLIDLRGVIPTVVQITAGTCAEVAALDALTLEPGAIYLMDRAYVDFACLARFTEEAAFFVSRPKKSIRFRRRSSRPVEAATGLVSDHVVVLGTTESHAHYPHPLRRVRYVDPDTHKRLVFLTNNFTLPALTVAQFYKARWQVELFFKWIKQPLRLHGVFRHDRERREDADLDRAGRVCPRRHRPEATRARPCSRRCPFFAAVSEVGPQCPRRRGLQPTAALQLMTGHYWFLSQEGTPAEVRTMAKPRMDLWTRPLTGEHPTSSWM
jgi:hypothetical protein